MKKKLTLWFIANALLPIAVPVLFLAGLTWFKNGTFPIWDITKSLVEHGFYIFSATALLFSLFEDYRSLKDCTTILDGVFIVLALAATCVMFQLSYSDVSYMASHLLQFILVWLFSAIYATILKIRQIKQTIKYRRQWT